MKTDRFIFDTNSLISALILPSSINRRCLEKADDLGFLIFSKETLDEFNNVVVRAKFDKYIFLQDRLEFAERLEKRSIMIETHSIFSDCRDPKDNKFLNLAYDAHAGFIITGDKDLQTLNPFYQTQIISPREFINL